jgi:hypothetical protein
METKLWSNKISYLQGKLDFDSIFVVGCVGRIIQYLIQNFRNVLETCQLSDLGFIGSKFTWCNNKEDEYFMKKRLN